MDEPSTSSSGRAFPLPTISEDTLHYVLHVPSQPPPAAAAQREGEQADLAALATLISGFVSSLLPAPWLWNKDAWELKVAGSDGSGVERSGGDGEKLEGTMRVGDAVDDEWLVVWLLREVSRRWKELVISIRDTDGEFLLIEAAHVLPDWVSPENATNRLWLHDGHLHLLPLSVRSGSRPHQLADSDYDSGVDAWISEEDAVRAVRTGRYAAPEVENAVWERISCYPAALKTHQHRAKAYLPVPVARALLGHPELIQRAVEGFYVRDPAQLRAASRMTHFPPSPAVLASVPMTRAAYAQLQGQVFHPPRVFGPEWHVREDQGESERRWRDLGVKIATGFEIMYREGGRKGRVADASASPEDLANEPGYARYIDDLQKAGYFGEEVRGSARWKSREVEAARGWVEARSSDTTQQRPSFAYLVDSAIASTKPEDVEKAAGEEDSDKWLEVDPDELDAMMKRAAGGGAAPRGADDELDAEHGRALKDLAGQLEAFVGGEGDLEGARFADELSDEDMDSASESGDDEPTAAEREERLRNLVAALPAGEWGAATRPPPELSQDEDDGDVDMATASSNRKGTVAGSAYGDSLLPPSMRPPVFEKVHYDGVESDSSDEDEEDLPPKGTLGRHISEMKWGDGAPRTQPEATIEEINEDEDGEDKADKERREALKFDDDIDELMRQRVWGGEDDGMEDDDDEGEEGKKGKSKEEDVDMDGDQTAEFLKFARAELGIDEDMWSDILAQRRARGAFVPETTAAASKSQAKEEKESARKPKPEPKAVASKPDTSSFESMMAAMDGELARHAATPSAPAPKPMFTKPASAPTSSSKKKKAKKAKKATVSFAETDEPDEPTPGRDKGKGKGRFTSLASLPDPDELDSLSDDALAQMDAELRAALKESGADLDDDEDAQGLEGDERVQYNMLKDMLESYASQGGQAGPMGNLVGRLGEVANKDKK